MYFLCAYYSTKLWVLSLFSMNLKLVRNSLRKWCYKVALMYPRIECKYCMIILIQIMLLKKKKNSVQMNVLLKVVKPDYILSMFLCVVCVYLTGSWLMLVEKSKCTVCTSHLTVSKMYEGQKCTAQKAEWASAHWSRYLNLSLT